MKGFIFVVIIVVFLTSLLFLFRTNSKVKNTADEKVNITASFTIITDRVTRSFKAGKYHNKSPDVFITSGDPSIVYVKKRGITWNDFFKSLPMKLTKECLTTGDGETFCDGKSGTLMFYPNDIEDKDLLDKEIKQGDSILIKFTSS